MKDLTRHIELLISRYPVLEESKQDIEKAIESGSVPCKPISSHRAKDDEARIAKDRHDQCV